jgi:hypothetical protein
MRELMMLLQITPSEDVVCSQPFFHHHLCLTFIAGLLDAIARGLLSDPNVINARILATNLSSGFLSTSVWWTKIGNRELGEPQRHDDEEGLAVGQKPFADYPW